MENLEKNKIKTPLLSDNNKIISNTAKQTENISRRTKIVNNQETKELLLNDTLKVIDTTLNKEGHTGKLSNADGIIRGEPMMYRGFFIQCYAYTHYESDFDIFGKLIWYGWAKKEKSIGGGKEVIEFAAHDHATEHSAGSWLTKLVDAYYGNKLMMN